MNRAELNKKLLETAKSGGVETLLHLIEQGAQIDTRNSDGQNAMHIAAINGHTDIVVALLGLGATPNTIDNVNWTPLHWASERGHPETVSVLLAHGARLNSHTITGKTPLDVARDSDSGTTAMPIYEFISRKHAERTKREYIALQPKPRPA